MQTNNNQLLGICYGSLKNKHDNFQYK